MWYRYQSSKHDILIHLIAVRIRDYLNSNENTCIHSTDTSLESPLRIYVNCRSYTRKMYKRGLTFSVFLVYMYSRRVTA